MPHDRTLYGNARLSLADLERLNELADRESRSVDQVFAAYLAPVVAEKLLTAAEPARPTPDAVTILEASEKLGCVESTVKRAIRSYRIPRLGTLRGRYGKPAGLYSLAALTVALTGPRKPMAMTRTQAGSIYAKGES